MWPLCILLMQASAQAKIEAQQVLAAVEPNASPMKKRFAGSKAGTLDCKTTRTIPSFDSQEVNARTLEGTALNWIVCDNDIDVEGEMQE